MNNVYKPQNHNMSEKATFRKICSISLHLWKICAIQILLHSFEILVCSCVFVYVCVIYLSIYIKG